MNMKSLIYRSIWGLSVWAARITAAVALMAAVAGYAQTPPASVSPDLQEIVKFTQAHMSDDVVISYIKNANKTYSLSADDMLYLNSQGVSQAVLAAMLSAKSAAGSVPPPAPVAAPAPEPASPPPVAPPTPGLAPAPMAPPPGLADNFGMDGGLNPSLWTMQSGILAGLAANHGSALVPASLGFSPAGMQMSGPGGIGQMTGIQSIGSYAAPFSMSVTVSGNSEVAIPFEVYLVTADLRQWLSLSGHLGGPGARPGGDIRVSGGIPGLFGHVNIPLGGERRSPEHGVWINYTGSALPPSVLGFKIFEEPLPGVPYTIQMTVGPDGLASVVFLTPAGMTLAERTGLSVGTGPFNVVLATRNGPTAANWNSVQLAPLGPPPAPVVAAPPETPTLDYFQAHLTPYGQWVDVPGVGAAWVPAEANNPLWRPYMDAGHWEYTDAGWFWASDYPWGDMAFHYGRWIDNEFTGGRWAWVPGYDWAPSWVAWREGDGGLGWAPLPWGVDFRVGVGLFWHGGLVVDGGVGIDFGLGFDAFCFVGADHFWGGDYHRYAFDRERAHAFYDHSHFHAGYHMEGGHLRAEGLGREHMAAMTHHEVAEHRASEMRHAEEGRHFAQRTAEHKELARSTERGREPGRAEANRPADQRERTAASNPNNRPGANSKQQPVAKKPAPSKSKQEDSKR